MKRLYSMVIQPGAEYILQAQRLIWSLRTYTKVSQEQIILHIAGALDKTVLMNLEELDITPIEVTPYANNPWCNKLQQLNKLSDRSFDEIVLLDCDMIVRKEPTASHNAIRAKQEDLNCPPINFFKDLFFEAGLKMPPLCSTFQGEKIVRGYSNRGVYIIPAPYFATLSRAWQYWTKWCINRKHLISNYWNLIDQVSFAMSIHSEKLDFKELEASFNFPTHVKMPNYFDCDPAILHYHRALDFNQNLLPVRDLPCVNAAISQINRAWSIYFRRHFDNISFWNSRYSIHPEFGSGETSRGDLLDLKQRLLERIVEFTSAISVVDIGGGDGKVMAGLQQRLTIVALDASLASKALYLKNIPNAQWFLHNICLTPFKHDCNLTICLELLTHCSTNEDYQNALDNICFSANDLIISGFEALPIFCGQTSYFHEPLSESLRKRGRIPIPIFFYNGITLFFSPRNNQKQHIRDIRPGTLEAAIPLVNNPLLLIEAINVSRQNVGFFPDHLPRCVEYPWIIDSLGEHQCQLIIDAGAGISSLPLLLAKRGHKVITVDPHETNRTNTPINTWNEWGFLDYHTLNSQITSFNIPYEDLDDELTVDVVVSVSVIEHLTCKTRQNFLKKANRQLKKGGTLLLTVDTVPFSLLLYNFNEGKLVEDSDIHGDLPMLMREIKDNGFALELMQHSNWLPQSRVGIARIRARKIS